MVDIHHFITPEPELVKAIELVQNENMVFFWIKVRNSESILPVIQDTEVDWSMLDNLWILKSVKSDISEHVNAGLVVAFKSFIEEAGQDKGLIEEVIIKINILIISL